MKRTLRGLRVVVTGASSGIGRETALRLARKGAKVVLAARREEPLEEVARLCREQGGEAAVVPTDVSDRNDVERLVAESVAAFSGVDVWVNNAGIYAMGTVEQTPLEVYERVMEVNFLASVAATKAILPHFRDRRSGMFVNISSAIGRVTAPYVSAYSASKHALKAFSDSLRDEVRDLGIDVSTVFPTSTDTPLFEHTANFSGTAVKPADPIYPVEEVADAILATIENPKRDVVIGAAKAFSAFYGLAPSLFDRVMTRKIKHSHFRPEAQGPTEGNLYEPMQQGRGSSGGWRKPSGAAKKFAAAALALAAVPLVLRKARS